MCGREPGVELGERGFRVELVKGERALGILIGLRMSLVVCWGNCEEISILQVDKSVCSWRKKYGRLKELNCDLQINLPAF